MADPFSSTGDDGSDSDFWRNLMAFGFSTMAAAKPGVSALGAIGQGGVGAMENARQNQASRVQNAQMGLLQQEAAQRRIQSNIQAGQYNLGAEAFGLPQIDPSTGNFVGNSKAPAMTPSIGGGAGMPTSPSAGQNTQTVSAPAASYGSQSGGGGMGGGGFQQASAMPQSMPQSGMSAITPASIGAPMMNPNSPLTRGIRPQVLSNFSMGTPQELFQLAQAYEFVGRPEAAKSLYSLATAGPQAWAKVAPDLAEKGFAQNPNGGQSFIPGGAADPRYLANVEGSKAWASAPATAWTNSMRPETLRGPGSVYVNPMQGYTIQVPNEITKVDPQTLAQYKSFVPLGLQTTGNAPGFVTGQSNSPQPQANGQAQGGSAPNAGGETSFMTGAPPGQEKIVQGAAENYTAEGRKSYESAVDLKGSIEYIMRDIDTMGPNGFTAMGSGADARNQFARAINTAQQMGGMQPSFDPTKIGAWEDFKKESVLGGMKGLAAIFGGSREAGTIINSSIGAFPHPENSYQGAQLLVHAFDEAANHEIDQRNFETNWATDPTHSGNLTGANEAFNQQFPSAKYTRRAISYVQPYKVSSPDDAMKRYLPGTRVQTPDGRILLVPGAQSVPLNGASGG